jgi:hypothetical protein
MCDASGNVTSVNGNEIYSPLTEIYIDPIRGNGNWKGIRTEIPITGTGLFNLRIFKLPIIQRDNAFIIEHPFLQFRL